METNEKRIDVIKEQVRTCIVNLKSRNVSGFSIISNNEYGVSKVHAFKISAKIYNIKTAIPKRKILVIAREPTKCEIVINGETTNKLWFQPSAN